MPARKYPWEDWFGQSRTVLFRGVDYTASQSTMTQNIRNYATKHGLRVKVTDSGDRLVIEVRDDEEAEQLESVPYI